MAAYSRGRRNNKRTLKTVDAAVRQKSPFPARGLNEYVKDGLIEACRDAIRPLVRLCLRQGISFGEFTRALEYVFIESATEDHLGEDRSTPAQVAVLTGIPQRQVAQLLGSEPESRILATRMLAAGQILSAWHADPDYTGPYGIPVELEFEGDGSFSELCQKYARHVAPQEILDELMSVGCVARGQSGSLSVIRRSYISDQLGPVALNYFGKSLRNLAETLVVNLEAKAPEEKRFERQVVSSGGIRDSDLGAFLELLQEAGQKFLEDLDSWIAEREKALKRLEKVPNEIPRVYPAVGTYLFFDKDPTNRKTAQ